MYMAHPHLIENFEYNSIQAHGSSLWEQNILFFHNAICDETKFTIPNKFHIHINNLSLKLKSKYKKSIMRMMIDHCLPLHVIHAFKF